MLRIITKAEWYIRNEDIHNDLNIETIKKKSSKKHTDKLLSHKNLNLRQIPMTELEPKRFKRRTPTELNY